jgi:hypothetical protein
MPLCGRYLLVSTRKSQIGHYCSLVPRRGALFQFLIEEKNNQKLEKSAWGRGYHYCHLDYLLGREVLHASLLSCDMVITLFPK